MIFFFRKTQIFFTFIFYVFMSRTNILGRGSSQPPTPPVYSPGHVLQAEVKPTKPTQDWMDATWWLYYFELPTVYFVIYFQDCCKLVFNAARRLDEIGMIRFDKDAKTLNSTVLGRIASDVFIRYDTVEVFNGMINPSLNEGEILNIMANAQEFEHLKVLLLFKYAMVIGKCSRLLEPSRLTILCNHQGCTSTVLEPSNYQRKVSLDDKKRRETPIK